MDVLSQPLLPSSISLRQVAPLALGAVALFWLMGSGRFARFKTNPSWSGISGPRHRYKGLKRGR